MMTRVFKRLPELVNADAGLVRRGRFLTVTFLVEHGDTAYLVRVHEGRVERVERGPFLMCTPDDTRQTGAAIKGARVTVMRGLGHFPMSEHPAQFRGYLLPVLDDIRAHAGRP
jgi:pimeloyl-ACP methyl ester carboxylesterase